jgi:hypothetical protein
MGSRLMPRKSKLLAVPPRPSRRKIELPPELANLHPSTRSLASGSYQRKILAFFAPFVIPKSMRYIAEKPDDELTSADLKQVFELYDMAGGKAKGVSIFVNQNNQTANIQASRSSPESAISFEEIARIAAERRRLRIEGVPAATSVAAGTYVPTDDTIVDAREE